MLPAADVETRRQPCKDGCEASGPRRISCGMTLVARALATMEFVAVDTETNGRAGEACELTEVGTVLVGGGELHDRFESLVAPRERLRRALPRFFRITPAPGDAAPSSALPASRRPWSTTRPRPRTCCRGSPSSCAGG